MNYNGTEYVYITNIQGDIIELVHITGTSVVKYTYDAWGNIIYQTGGSLAEINPYRYRGYRYDSETGWYYLQSRYYDPTIGRFINADGLLGEVGDPLNHNMYAYCANNPVMYVDPDGDFPILISLTIIFGIGALSGVAGTFIGDLATSLMTGEWSFSSWETYAGAAIGYGTAALIMPYNPTLALAVGSGLSTFAGMSLEKATGTSNASWGEIALWSAVSAGIGAIMGQATKGLRISGITSGRGSYQHVMRTQFTNMIKHGYDISFKTAVKSFTAMTASRQITGGISTGLKRTSIELWEYFRYGDREGLGWV